MYLNFSCFSLNVRGFVTLLNEKPYFYFVILKEEMFIFYRKLTLLLMMSLFGVIILFKYNFNGKILESHFSQEGRWIIAIVQSGEAVFIFCNVYGFNNSNLNQILFQTLSNKLVTLKLKFPSAAVIVGGDFNEAPDLHLDRFPPETQCQ